MYLHVYVLCFCFIKENYKLMINIGFKCSIIETKIMKYDAKSRPLTLSIYLLSLVFISIVNFKIKEFMQMLEYH
jgi:hypothetical protein